MQSLIPYQSDKFLQHCVVIMLCHLIRCNTVVVYKCHLFCSLDNGALDCEDVTSHVMCRASELLQLLIRHE